jgi:FKBP-type peptidyl-prolyl cis-trans isomerase FklB
MKINLFLSALSFALCPGLLAGQITDSLSYSIGVQIASNLKKNGIIDKFEINSSFLEAFVDVKSGNPKIKPEDMERIVSSRFIALHEKEKKENEDRGKAFLEDNAKKADVVSLPSGLQYRILKEGSGAKPTPENNVEVHYTGSLVDGTVFESSRTSGTPAKFMLKEVIPGWTEGLQHIAEGGKIQLFIPHKLAYGERNMPGSPIGPCSTLIFEIELLKVE